MGPDTKTRAQKKARKAVLGGFPKLINIPRNWVHQAMSYMDAGELSTRILIEICLIVIFLLILVWVWPDVNFILLFTIAFVVAHSLNWVLNGLFWSVIIFTFPGLRNPGANATVHYLNQMRDRISRYRCITGVMIYGSVTRGTWHDRSDIDIRFLRRPGFAALWCAAWVTMRERFRAFVEKQPMDLYFADDIDFLKKLRADEIPLILLCRDDRLKKFYANCEERSVQLSDLLGAPESKINNSD